jgi:histidinol-phosphate aminotransferase
MDASILSAETPVRGPRPKPGILDIAPYVAGKAPALGSAHAVKLSSNENVLGCSPLAKAAYAEGIDGLHLYPDGAAGRLREKIAAAFHIEPERLIFGCGSDEIFTLLAQAYCGSGDNVVQGRYGFLAYAIAAGAAGAQVRIAEEPGLRITPETILAAVDERTRIVFLANPANPTGACLTREDIGSLHAALPPEVILVLDGAYAEFVDGMDFDDGLGLARTAPNVVITRTFSKIYGLAALRVGWGYGPQAIIDALERIRGPFNVNGPAIAAATAALDDAEFVERSRAHVVYWRPWLAQQIGGLGLETFPSQANFVLVRFPTRPGRTASEAEAFLAREGLIVRGLKAYGLADCLRITIGVEADNRRVVEALGAFMAS